MNVKVNNDIIATFLGLKPDGYFYEGWKLKEAGLPFIPGIHGNGTSNLKFHSSYDWLFVAIRKLQSVTEEPEVLDDLERSLWFNDIAYVCSDVVDAIHEYNYQQVQQS